MSSTDVWHLKRKKSWWDGSLITWCGLRFEGSTYEGDLFHIGPKKKCPACERAWKNPQ